MIKNEVAIRAINSMNYLFLKEVFGGFGENNPDIAEKIKLNTDLAYEGLISEISFFLESLNEESINDEIKEILQSEMDEGEYIENLSFEDAKNILSKGIEAICGCKNTDALKVYIARVSNIKNN